MSTLKNKRGVSLVIFVLTIIFFYLPLMLLIVFSFNSGKGIRWESFSFKWYVKLFGGSRNIWRAFYNSVIVAITSSAISTAIGTIGGIGLHLYNVKYKKYLKFITYIPLIIPDIIMGVSLLIFFAGLKWKLSLFTIFIAHTTFNISFVLLIILSRLEEFDRSILEAAYDLGATELQALFKVLIPVTIPGIVAGFLMAVTLSLDDFVITFFVAGPGSSTLPLQIYSMIRFGVSPVINAVSVILIGFTILTTSSTKRVRKYMLS